MNELDCDAVVVRRVDYGDAHLILTLLTRDGGKLSALARSARRSQRRFGGALGSFTRSRMTLSRRPRSELWTLTSATPVRAYAELAADVTGLAHASYATELVRELVAPEVSETGIFDLLIELYDELAARGGHPPILRAFELRLVRAVGIEPSIGGCAACNDCTDGAFITGAMFDPARGGAICRSCAAASLGVGVRPLSADARARLREAGEVASLAEARALAHPAEGAGEARDLMLAYLGRHLGKELKTLDFVAKMRSAPR